MAGVTEQIIMGIDVGSSKVALLAAHLSAAGGLTLLGGGQIPAKGLRRGVVASGAASSAAIARALELTATWHSPPPDAIYLSLNGKHLKGQNLRGMAGIASPDGTVTPADLAHAIGAARATLRMDDHEELVHLLPRGYLLDGQDGIRNPLGMSGVELAVEAHAVTGHAATIENLVRAARKARVIPDDLVATPLAAAEAVAGRFGEAPSIAVAEIGAETIGLALLDDGAICHSQVLPIGGASITREIALALRLPLDAAETLKCAYGHCDPRQLSDDELVDLRALTQIDEVLPRRLLAEIVRARARALAEALRPPLAAALRVGLRPVALVITGGGAELAGFDQLLMDLLDLPIYRGGPSGIRGLPPAMDRPSFAVVAGLVLWGAHRVQGPEGAAATGRPAARVAELLLGARRWIGGE